MLLSFCAIDFETANRFRASPCAVGLAKVLDGRVVDTRRYLMRPPEGYDEFEPFNVHIHGITAAMVHDQPCFAQRLPEILNFADRLPFVAHNAGFDMGVLRDACSASDVAWPEAEYACTLGLARVTWDLLSIATESRSWGRRAWPFRPSACCMSALEDAVLRTTPIPAQIVDNRPRQSELAGLR